MNIISSFRVIIIKKKRATNINHNHSQMAVFKSDILQVAIPLRCPSTVAITIHPSSMESRRERAPYAPVNNLRGSQGGYVISGQVASYLRFQRYRIGLHLWVLFLWCLTCAFAPQMQFAMHFCSGLCLLFPDSHWSPGDNWRPQLTNQLPLASPAQGIHSPSDESQRVIIIAKQQLARAGPGYRKSKWCFRTSKINK